MLPSVSLNVIFAATLKQIVATLPQLLREVEVGSTLQNVRCNKNVAKHVYFMGCDIRQFLVQLVLQQNCEISCKKN